MDPSAHQASLLVIGLLLVGTAAAVLGAVRYAGRSWRTWQNRAALKREPVDGLSQRTRASRRMLATMRVERFLWLVVVFELFALVGVLALLLPVDALDGLVSELLGLTIVLVLLSAECAMVVLGERGDLFQGRINRLLQLEVEEELRARHQCASRRRQPVDPPDPPTLADGGPDPDGDRGDGG